MRAKGFIDLLPYGLLIIRISREESITIILFEIRATSRCTDVRCLFSCSSHELTKTVFDYDPSARVTVVGILRSRPLSSSFVDNCGQRALEIGVRIKD